MQPYDETLVNASATKIAARYEKAGVPLNAGTYIWMARIVYDYCNGLSWAASESKHLVELDWELGLHPIKPSDWTINQLRAFWGDFNNVIVPGLTTGRTPNLFTPGYVCEPDNVRAQILASYPYTHFPINTSNHSPIYRDWYPSWDESLINQYLSEIWAAGKIPVCAIFPDNEKYINPVLDPNLVRICFWWEDSTPIIRPVLDGDNKFWLIRQRFPDTLIYWHNPPNQDAPYINYADWGLQPNDPGANMKVWQYLYQNNLCKGLLFQGQAWNGVDNSINNLADFLERLPSGGKYLVDLDVVDFEETAYAVDNNLITIDAALALTKQIRVGLVGHEPNINGFCNG